MSKQHANPLQSGQDIYGAALRLDMREQTHQPVTALPSQLAGLDYYMRYPNGNFQLLKLDDAVMMYKQGTKLYSLTAQHLLEQKDSSSTDGPVLQTEQDVYSVVQKPRSASSAASAVQQAQVAAGAQQSIQRILPYKASRNASWARRTVEMHLESAKRGTFCIVEFVPPSPAPFNTCRKLFQMTVVHSAGPPATLNHYLIGLKSDNTYSLLDDRGNTFPSFNSLDLLAHHYCSQPDLGIRLTVHSTP
eukprot:m.357857 g.357857  ORF g.357857 m.357857 type:complete len:247 (-) comp17959_c0_seq1:443-1183(-)